MTELVLAKAAGDVLVPMDDQSRAFIQRCKLGQGFSVQARLHNNPLFHAKLMKLFHIAFDAYEPAELMYNGEIVRKEFTQFRKDITILAGYYDTCVDLRGRVKLTAQSLNFANMDQVGREAVFNSVIDVVLDRVLTNYRRADLDDVIAQLLGMTR